MHVVFFVAAIIRIASRYTDKGPCRNDKLTLLDAAYLWVALICNALLGPVLKFAYEVTHFIRRDADAITLSEAEEWRKRLRYPFMDVFVTTTPILGALLLPEVCIIVFTQYLTQLKLNLT